MGLLDTFIPDGSCFGNKACQEQRSLDIQRQQQQLALQQQALNAFNAPTSSKGKGLLIAGIIVVVVVISIAVYLKVKKQV